MWRPEGWTTQFDCSVCDTEPEGCLGCGSNAFEAGADAMLEGLRANRVYSLDENSMILSAAKILEDSGYKKGYLVFIPEEKE